MIFYSSFKYSYRWLPLLVIVIRVLASMIGGGWGFFSRLCWSFSLKFPPR